MEISIQLPSYDGKPITNFVLLLFLFSFEKKNSSRTARSQVSSWSSWSTGSAACVLDTYAPVRLRAPVRSPNQIERKGRMPSHLSKDADES